MYRLIAMLFPGPHGMSMAQDIDTRIGELPGMAGLGLMVPFTQRAQQEWAQAA
jgi:hypothetical protein